jgi:hypothetical protein
MTHVHLSPVLRRANTTKFTWAHLERTSYRVDVVYRIRLPTKAPTLSEFGLAVSTEDGLT